GVVTGALGDPDISTTGVDTLGGGCALSLLGEDGAMAGEEPSGAELELESAGKGESLASASSLQPELAMTQASEPTTHARCLGIVFMRPTRARGLEGSTPELSVVGELRAE